MWMLTQQKHSPHGSSLLMALLLKQRELKSIISSDVVPNTCTVSVLQNDLTALSSNLHAQTLSEKLSPSWLNGVSVHRSTCRMVKHYSC